jgi:hypothetical protein
MQVAHGGFSGEIPREGSRYSKIGQTQFIGALFGVNTYPWGDLDDDDVWRGHPR